MDLHRFSAFDYMKLVVGSALVAAAFQFFTFPNSIVSGGVTGIAQIIRLLTGIPVGVLSILINIPIFYLGWRHRLGTRRLVLALCVMALISVLIDALALTGLTALQDRILSTLSGGERQRAWIAMTIAQEPEILILDEPTTYLDVSYQVEVLELVKKLNRELGITIIMVLHDINLAARYSDVLMAVKGGRLYAAGTPAEIVNKKYLQEIFEIEASVYTDPVHKCPYFIPLRTTIHEKKA